MKRKLIILNLFIFALFFDACEFNKADNAVSTNNEKTEINEEPKRHPSEIGLNELLELLELYARQEDESKFTAYLESFELYRTKAGIYTHFGIKPSNSRYTINNLFLGRFSFKTKDRQCFFPLHSSIKERGKLERKSKLNERELLEVYLIDSVSISIYKSIDDNYYPPGGDYELAFKKN